MRLLAALVAVVIAATQADAARAQETLLSTRIMNETQLMSEGSDELIMVWWMPTEYWMALFSEDDTLSDADKAEMKQSLDRHNIVLVVNGKIGAFGDITYLEPAEIRAGTVLTVNGRDVYQPLEEDDVGHNLKVFLSVMRPIFEGMLGNFGENANFILYKGEDNGGNRIADPTAEGRLEVSTVGKSFAYELPLVSLLPARIDPESGEEFPGDYRFNPYTGSELVVRPGE